MLLLQLPSHPMVPLTTAMVDPLVIRDTRDLDTIQDMVLRQRAILVTHPTLEAHRDLDQAQLQH